MLALLCFCVATEFSVNKDLYIAPWKITIRHAGTLTRNIFFYLMLDVRTAEIK